MQHWKTLDWPQQSPDLNPTENFRAILKKKVCTTNFSRTLELKAKIIAVWNHHIAKDLLEKLAFSMPDRLRAAIRPTVDQPWVVVHMCLYLLFYCFVCEFGDINYIIRVSSTKTLSNRRETKRSCPDLGSSDDEPEHFPRWLVIQGTDDDRQSQNHVSPYAISNAICDQQMLDTVKHPQLVHKNYKAYVEILLWMCTKIHWYADYETVGIFAWNKSSDWSSSCWILMVHFQISVQLCEWIQVSSFCPLIYKDRFSDNTCVDIIGNHEKILNIHG